CLATYLAWQRSGAKAARGHGVAATSSEGRCVRFIPATPGDTSGWWSDRRRRSTLRLRLRGHPLSASGVFRLDLTDRLLPMRDVLAVGRAGAFKDRKGPLPNAVVAIADPLVSFLDHHCPRVMTPGGDVPLNI